MSAERALLLTSHPPGGHGVGQIYVRSLCGLLPPGSCAVAALLGPNDVWTPATELELAGSLRLERKYESVYRPLRGILGEALALAGVVGRLQPHVRRLVEQTTNWARQEQIERVIAVLDGPSTFLMAAALADRLDVPLQTLVWDAPEHVLSLFGHTGWSAGPLRRGFGAALRRSASVAVMSGAMQRRFADEYGARCTILHQPIDDRWIATSSVGPRHADEEFLIGFAGSVTARDELELLCRALDSVEWWLAGRPVRLRIYGLRYVCQAQTARWIDYRGYVPETADVVAGLAECDVLFLPQPFGAAGRPFAEYSFPTKFTTYLAAGRPLLLLAPEYSALAEFCRDHDLPIVCTQPDAAALLEHLQRVASAPALARDIEQRQQAVAAEEFSVRVAREHVREWLGMDGAVQESGQPLAAPKSAMVPSRC